MTDIERAYEAGRRSVWLQILKEATGALGGEHSASGRWLIERTEAVAVLRQVCEKYGDNDWPDNLNLADVIAKHLERNLDE
jgi:hypothetical protein